MSLGDHEDGDDSLVSLLAATHGERIVGFYSGLGIWSSHKVSITSTQIFLVSPSYAKNDLYSLDIKPRRTLRDSASLLPRRLISHDKIAEYLLAVRSSRFTSTVLMEH